MNSIKKLYKEFFGIQEAETKSSSMFHVSAEDVTNMQKMAAAAKQLKQNLGEEEIIDEAKPGLYANIHAKRKRIAAGSGERMRKPGSKGAPTAQAFKDAAKTAKK